MSELLDLKHSVLYNKIKQKDMNMRYPSLQGQLCLHSYNGLTVTR